MLKLCLIFILCTVSASLHSQPPTVEMYDLLRRLISDSTGFENVGDWAVGQPRKYPVSWNADKIEMSNDTSINFYRLGSADIKLNGRSIMFNGKPVKWNVMLKGPRMGYSSFSMISTPGKNIGVKYSIDSLFGNRDYTAKLVKACDKKDVAGFYYYHLKLPKKDPVYLKLSWISLNGNTALRVDVYDLWSSYAAKLNCAD